MSSFSEELFMRVPVVGILRGYPTEDVMKIAEAFFESGFTNLEVTMNTSSASVTIDRLSKRYKGKLNIGAGTVCTISALKEAIDAGSKFVVTPIFNPQIIHECNKRVIPVFPGAFTPTEIYNAWQAGARMVKVFPASQLGPSYIKEILAPLDGVKLMPTGGINLDNIPEYLAAGAKAFGMGSLLFDKDLIQQKSWNELTGKLIFTKEKMDIFFKK